LIDMAKQLIFIYFSVTLALISFLISLGFAIKNPTKFSSWIGMIGYGLYTFWGLWVIFF